MSTPTAADERPTATTADYANVLFGGDTTATQQQDETTTVPTEPEPAQQRKATSTKKPTAKRAEPDDTKDKKNGALRALGNAENWMPRDFASVAPSTLVDAVAAHRDRYQGLSNIGVKVLYGFYTAVAVPTGFILNVVSLVAAHAATALNEPSRAREAALGIVFLGIIGAALLWIVGG